MSGEDHVLRQPRRSAPFFRARTRAVLFLVTFLVFLFAQLSVVLATYWKSRDAITEILRTRLSAAAESADAGISLLAAQGATRDVLESMLWRVRESHRLEHALIVDRDGNLLVSTWGAPAGTPASVFAVSPGAVERVFETAAPQYESVEILGEPYRRACLPVMRNEEVWGVLCLDSLDSLPQALRTIEGPFWLGLLVSLLAAFLLGAAVLLMVRFMESTRRHVLRMERLAAAGRLAASIAHEVRNPLGIILSTAQLLEQDETLGRQARQFLASIEEEVRRATDHLESFLDLSRDVPLRRSAENLCAVIRSTVDLLSARSRQAGVSLKTDLPDGPLSADVDVRKIRQVLVNIVLNSIEALSGMKDGMVIIAAGKGGLPGYIEIRVQDNGPGMPSDIKDMVFEPFYSTKESGTGLGLPHAKQIVTRHGGSISVDSKPGSGTVVTIQLPSGGSLPRNANSDSR